MSTISMGILLNGTQKNYFSLWAAPLWTNPLDWSPLRMATPLLFQMLDGSMRGSTLARPHTQPKYQKLSTLLK